MSMNANVEESKNVVLVDATFFDFDITATGDKDDGTTEVSDCDQRAGSKWLDSSCAEQDENSQKLVLDPKKEKDKYSPDPREQYDKVLTYDYKYLPQFGEKAEQVQEETPTSHYDFNFSEKDYRRHRKLSHHYHAPILPLSDGKHRRRKKLEKEKEKEQKYPKSPQKLAPIQPLCPLQEYQELTGDQLTDKENEPPIWPKGKKDSGLHKSKHRSRHHHHHRQVDLNETTKHHHHRKHHHHTVGITEDDKLEFRLRSGLQTLEDEKKAISAITAEIGDASDLLKDEEDAKLGLKDQEDMKSHRFEDLKGMRRRQVRRRQVSGMPTVVTHTEVALEMKPTQVQITMPKFKYDHTPNEGFVELEELTCGENNELQWKERARWIKFEEDVEKNERWGKPHVASLSFQSLLELRKGIEIGTVLLDLEMYDLPSIFEAIVENMIITDQLSRANKETVLDILMAKHRHQHQQPKVKRSFSFSSMSSFSLDLSHRIDKDSEVEKGQDGTPTTEDQLESTRVKDGVEVTDISSNHAVNGSNHDAIDTSTTSTTTLTTTKAETSKSVAFQIGEPEIMGDDGENTIDDSPLCSDVDNFSLSSRKSSVRFGPTTTTESSSDAKKRKQSEVTTRVPTGAEATSVLVGSVPDLHQPTVAFVRLARGCYLGNLTEVSIPVRFLFVILGPTSSKVDYYEIGRSVATLMADKIFHDNSYAAKTRDDLLSAINSFLDDSIVLAPGDWDRHLLLPLLEAEIASKKKQRKLLLRDKAVLDRPGDEQPFLRMGKLFGGLTRDVKRRKAHYYTDFVDGLNLRCLIAIVFIFFATLAPTITFGGLLSSYTQGSLGVIETIMATAICGTVFGLFSGQPLIIVGTTGPILVFEHTTYKLCSMLDLEFLPVRFWIGIWVLIILWILVAYEMCYFAEYFTRFEEEVLSVLISLLFIYEAMSFLSKVFKDHPLSSSHNPTITTHYRPVLSNHTTTVFTNLKLNTSVLPIITRSLKKSKSQESQPNTALFSTMLLLGTYFVSSYLRKLRHSHFFSSRLRRLVSDFGIPIAMLVMVSINFAVKQHVYVPNISMPKTISPTNRTTFLFNPMKLKKTPMSVANIILHIILCAIPAILVSILLFMETELTGVLLNKKKNKLRKGGGYNLDLFIMGLLTGISSILGLPWMCAATVRSVQHLNALAIMSRSHAPGERPYLLEIKEQRLTNVAIHILIGCTAFLGIFFTKIPFAVLYGVLLYLGITSLFAGIQLIEQMKLFIMPRKHYPSKKYIFKVPIIKIHVYTVVQLACLGVLCIIKLAYVITAPLFPFFMICMVGIRRTLGKILTEEELEELDNEEEAEYDEELDEYDTIYMPI